MASPSLSALWVQVSCGRWLLTSAPGAGLVRLKLSGASLTVLKKKRALTQELKTVPAKPRARPPIRRVVIQIAWQLPCRRKRHRIGTMARPGHTLVHQGADDQLRL